MGTLMLTGCAFMLLAALGILRMPDLFMRISAASKAITLGLGSLLGALALHFQDKEVTTKALLVMIFVFLKAPVAAHALARAAYRIGVELWSGTIVDELRQHYEHEVEHGAAGPTDQKPDQTAL